MKLHLPKRSKISLFTICLIISLTIVPFLANTVMAAGILTSRSVTISDSRAGNTGTSYTFAFHTPANTAIKEVKIEICNGNSETGSCVRPTGFHSTGGSINTDNLGGSGRTGSDFTSDGVIVIVDDTPPGTQSTQDISIKIDGLTNPTTANTTYYARITTYSDTGSTVIDGPQVAAFAILDTTSISVSATVDPTLTFSIAAVNSGGTVNGATTNITTTTTTIPFGVLAAGSTKIGAHDITVITNATGGYTTTVKAAADPPLVGTANSANNIDKFTGTNTSPASWSSPNGSTPSVNTGFFGYSTNDSSLGVGTTDRFTNPSDSWAGPTTTASEVAFNAGGTTSQTTRIGWQAEVNALQPADSYTGTVILVTTPTY